MGFCNEGIRVVQHTWDKYSEVSYGRWTIYFVAALIVLQPLLLLMAPYASAATLEVTPSHHLIAGNSEATSTANAAGYKDFTLSFNHTAEALEEFTVTGDSLVYGWRTSEGVDNQLGVIEGKTNVGGAAGEGENASKSHVLPAEAAVDGLTLYFRNTGGNNDTVEVSNISLTASLIDVTRPIVTSVQVPLSGNYLAESQLEFTVTFSETVTVTGSPRISLLVGDQTRYASYSGGSGSSVLKFVYQVGTGDRDADGLAINRLELNGGTIEDGAENAAVLDLNNVGATNGIIIGDVTPPQGVSIVGGNRLVGGLTSALLATSDEPNDTFYTWSGPNGVVFDAPNAAKTSVSVRDYGTYTFQLIARDSTGNSTPAQTVVYTFFLPSGTPSVVPSEANFLPHQEAIAPLEVVSRNASATNLSNTPGTRTYSTTSLLNGSDVGETDDASSGRQSDTAAASSGAVITSSEQGWKLWGIAWYWYALTTAIVAFLWWLVDPLIRRPQGE